MREGSAVRSSGHHGRTRRFGEKDLFGTQVDQRFCDHDEKCPIGGCAWDDRLSWA